MHGANFRLLTHIHNFISLKAIEQKLTLFKLISDDKMLKKCVARSLTRRIPGQNLATTSRRSLASKVTSRRSLASQDASSSSVRWRKGDEHVQKMSRNRYNDFIFLLRVFDIFHRFRLLPKCVTYCSFFSVHLQARVQGRDEIMNQVNNTLIYNVVLLFIYISLLRKVRNERLLNRLCKIFNSIQGPNLGT